MILSRYFSERAVLFLKLFLMVVFILFFISSDSEAEDLKSYYSIDEIVSFALERNGRINSVKKVLEGSKYLKKEALGAIYPDIKIIGSYRLLGPKDKVEFAGSSFQNNPDSITEAKIILNQWLFSKTTFVGLRGVSHLLKESEERVKEVEDEVVVSARIQFYKVMLSKEEINVRGASFSRLEEAVSDSRKRYQLGLSSKYELMRFESKLSMAKADLQRSENNLKSELFELAKIAGIEPTENFDIKGELEYQAGSVSKVGNEIEQIKKRADIKILKESLLGKREDLNRYKSDRWPTLKLDGSYGYSRTKGGFGGSDKFKEKWEVGLNLVIPIFDGGGRSGRIGRSRAELDRAIIESDELHRSAVVDIKKRWNDLELAEAYLRSQEENLEYTEESFRIAKESYKAGFINQLEFLDTELSLTLSKLDLSKAKFDAVLAREFYRLSIGEVIR